jgi:cytochrome c oxidase subunit 2
VPGFLREFWAKIDTVGTYRGQCSELCGKEHAYMPIVVNVVPQAEFDSWLKSKKTPL